MGTTKQKRTTKAAWYGVKTLFRTEAVGKPLARVLQRPSVWVREDERREEGRFHGLSVRSDEAGVVRRA